VNELVERLHLENAIHAAEERNRLRAAQDLKLRASKARDETAAVIANHPFAAVGAALAAGLVIGSLIPGRKLGARAGTFATIAREYGVARLRRAFTEAGLLANTGSDAEEGRSQEEEESVFGRVRALTARAGQHVGDYRRELRDRLKP